MIKHPKKRTELGDLDTLKYRIKHHFKENGLRIVLFFANMFSFGIIIAVIFKLLQTLSRIA